jgi:hypothetical protein
MRSAQCTTLRLAVYLTRTHAHKHAHAHKHSFSLKHSTTQVTTLDEERTAHNVEIGSLIDSNAAAAGEKERLLGKIGCK